MECFAFGGGTVRFASLETSFHAANHTIPPPPSYEGLPLCPKDKNRSPFHGEKPLKIVIYRLKAICQYSKRHSVGTCLWHVSMQTAMYQRIGNMPKACPYVIMRPPIVADINHRICEGKRDSGIFIFAFSDNLISKYWFFAEGEWFLSFWRCLRPRKRAALGVWCG